MTKASAPMSISKIRIWIILLSKFLTGISGWFPNLWAQIESTANWKNVASSGEKCGHLEICGMRKKEKEVHSGADVLGIRFCLHNHLFKRSSPFLSLAPDKSGWPGLAISRCLHFQAVMTYLGMDIWARPGQSIAPQVFCWNDLERDTRTFL